MNLEDLFLPRKKIFFIIFFIVIIIITIILIIGTIHLETDNDVTVLLPVNQETEFEREKINRLGNEFSSQQLLFIGIKNEPFTQDKIKKLWELCNEIENLDVVKSTLNPFNAIYFKPKQLGDKKFFIPAKLRMSNYPKSKTSLQDFIDKISSNRFLIGTVISYDKDTAGIVVRMNYEALMGKDINKKNIFIKFSSFFFGKEYGLKKIDRSYFCEQIENILKKYNKDFDIYYAGVPVYEAKTKAYMQKDIFFLIIPVFFMMAFIFFMNFRTKRGTLLPIISILLSMGWTMGIIGWIRYKLNIVGILIPPIVMTVGSSYTLHYLNSYYLNAGFYKNSRDLVYHSTKKIFPTIFLAALTTIIGFASFLTAKIKPIKMFGIFIIISITLTLFFTFFLLSKILALLPPPKIKKLENVKKDFFSKILNFSRDLVIPFRFVWAGIYILAFVLFIIFIPHLKVETNPANYFKKSDRVRQSLILLQKSFHGTNHYNITIRSIENKKDYFRTREGLESAKKIQKYFDNNVTIGKYEMIGWILSPVTLLEDLNYSFDKKREIPSEDYLIKNFFSWLATYRKKDDGLRSIINDNYSAITFQVRPHTTNPKEESIMTEQELAKLTEKLSEDLRKIAKSDGKITVELWGEILLLAKISKYLQKDQIFSLIITGILVFLITLIIFRSPYFAFFSLIPLSFGVIMNFTIMSIFGIRLDAATVMIAAISIGIGIDDSIHFILHYKKALKDSKNAKDAILHTITYTSRPILFTSLALILGFIVFLFSSFGPITYFGLLIAISMFNCTFATLFILPSFFIITDKIRQLFHKKKHTI